MKIFGSNHIIELMSTYIPWRPRHTRQKCSLINCFFFSQNPSFRVAPFIRQDLIGAQFDKSVEAKGGAVHPCKNFQRGSLRVRLFETSKNDFFFTWKSCSCVLHFVCKNVPRERRIEKEEKTRSALLTGFLTPYTERRRKP